MALRKILIPTLCFLLVLMNSLPAQAQSTSARSKWVDSVYSRLTLEERIGQLFMVAAYSGGKDYNEPAIKKLVAANQVGGLIFMQGTAEAQAEQTNAYQQMGKVPLLIGMDAEWGLGMRLTGVRDYPRQMMLGATRDTALMYRIGAAIAAQCKRLGVHIDFAPVVDVNNNPNNPIINGRSFGENKWQVSRMGIAYMRGLQDNGVLASAKHFPGHGDTKTDSHEDLPVINKTRAQLDTLELFPFRQLIRAGVKSVMVAHLQIPAFESQARTPTTLSKNTITNILRGDMGFNGLIFTDALNMEGVAKYYEPGEVDLRALMAGNDVLLFSQNVPVAINRIKEAIAFGKVTNAELEQHVKKILAAKYDVGLNRWKPINENNVTADLNQSTNALRLQTAQAAITLVRDQGNVLADIAQKKKVHYIGVNASGSTTLSRALDRELNVSAEWLPKGSSAATVARLLGTLNNNEVNVVAIHNLAFYPGSSGNHGLDAQELNFIRQLANKPNTMIVLMGNAYMAKHFCGAPGVIIAYEDDSVTQEVVAQVLTGRQRAHGILPVTPCPGMSMSITPGAPTGRVTEANPSINGRMTSELFVQDAGVTNTNALSDLNLFIERSIVSGAFPGCRILAAKNGRIFYDQSFGYFTYSKQQKVDSNTLYDVASLTKVMATTLAVMRLYEQGKLDLNKTLGQYLPWTAGTDKAGLRIKDLLLHQAGLKAWIPFYRETLDESGYPKTELYKPASLMPYNIMVAEKMYLLNTYVDTVWNTILTSPLENRGRYVYSDLDFYFLAEVVKQLTGKRVDKYVEEQFYAPMALKNTAYMPLRRFPKARIAPTENDMIYRHQQIQGVVHDQGAAMLGGVAGHAGIFATAKDVAVIFQMLMNKGVYNGKRYFKPATVEYFTAYNSRISRRGLGFDKPSADADDGGPTSNYCSGYTFGHQGFTGTCAWADPATGVVFVFLSNRVFPNAENNAINRLNIRTVAQDYVYEALGLKPDRNRPQIQQAQLALR